MKILSFIIVLLIFIFPAKSQILPTYYPNYYAIAGTLSKICMLDENNIFIVGHNGMLMESKDGGNNWKHIPLKTLSPINDIQYVNNTIVAICNNGEMVISKNKGKDWEYNNLLIDKGLRALSLVSENKWVIAGDAAIHISEDAGKSWESKAVKIDFAKVLFANENLIIVTNYSGISKLFSFDNGDTWQKNDDLEAECKNCNIKKIRKISNNTIAILLNNKLALSYDNGKTFTFQNLSQVYKDFYFKNYEFYGIKELSGVIKEYIEIYKEDFKSLSNERYSNLLDTSYGIDYNTTYMQDFSLTNNRAIAVGAAKSILISEDAGLNWKVISNLDAGLLENTFECITQNSKYIYVGAFRSKLFRSSNEGATWLAQKNNKLSKSRYISNAILDDNGEGVFFAHSTFSNFPHFGLIYNNGDSLIYIESEHAARDRSVNIFRKQENLFYQELSNISNSQNLISIRDKYFNILKIINTDSIDIVELNIIDSLNIEGWGNDFKGVKPKISGDWYAYSSPVHFWTNNGGISWQKDTINRKDSLTYMYHCSRAGEKIMYMAAQNMYFIDTNNIENFREILYVSDDYGKTWDKLSVWKGDKQNKYTDFAFAYVYEQNQDLYAFNVLKLFKYDKEGMKWDAIMDNNWGYYLGAFDHQRKILYDSIKDSRYIILSNNNKLPTIIKSYDFSQDTTSVEEIEVSDDKRALLYSSEPYPMPATSKIQSRIYWNQIYQITDANLSVFDIFGNKLLAPNLYIDASESYRGILTWECDNIDTGIYFIRVSLQNETINIPVTVYR